MNTMYVQRLSTILLSFSGFAQPALADLVSDINGLAVFPYAVGMDLDTVLTLNTADFPLAATIDERGFSNSDENPEINRHDVAFSADGGVSPRLFATGEAFDIAFSVSLTAGLMSPSKKAGIRLEQQGFDGIFYVDTETGEIAALGSVLPFFSFTESLGLTYQGADTARMRIVYVPPITSEGALLESGTIEYVVDLGEGALSSSPMPVEHEVGGILKGSIVAVYAEWSGDPHDPSDFATASFSNFDFNGLGPDPRADFDADGDTDGNDFVIWQRGVGIAEMASFAEGDADGDFDVDSGDLEIWRLHFGKTGPALAMRTVPEPCSALMLATVLVVTSGQRGVPRSSSKRSNRPARSLGQSPSLALRR